MGFHPRAPVPPRLHGDPVLLAQECLLVAEVEIVVYQLSGLCLEFRCDFLADLTDLDVAGRGPSTAGGLGLNDKQPGAVQGLRFACPREWRLPGDTGSQMRPGHEYARLFAKKETPTARLE